jgi:hypothetical protein
LIGTIKRVVSEANKWVVAVGGFIGALVAIWGAVQLVMPGGTPAVKFTQTPTVVEKEVPLNKFEELHPSKDPGSAFLWPRQPQPGYPATVSAVYVSTEARAIDAVQSATQPAPTYAASSPESGPNAGEGSDSGPTGTSGPTGPQGPTGTSGPTGPHKTNGASGPTGPHKTNGASGPTGPHKTNGASGPTGPHKTVGASGPTGPHKPKVGSEGHHGGSTVRSRTSHYREGNVNVVVGTGVSEKKVDEVIEVVKKILVQENQQNQLPSGCDTVCALTPLIDQAITGSSSNPYRAAGEVAAILADTRYTKNGHEPVGVAVKYKIELSDYAGKKGRMAWSLYSKATGKPLREAWWHNVIVKEAEPTAAEGSPVQGTFWVPLPRARGEYDVDMEVLTSENEEKGHDFTEPFN